MSLRHRYLATALATLAMGASHAWGLSQPDRTVTIYVHGYEGTGMDHDAPIGAEYVAGDFQRVLDMLEIPDGIDEPYAPDQLTAIEYRGNRLPALQDTWMDEADLAELRALMPPIGEGGLPLYALISAKFLRHVIERSGADGANLIGASLGGAITRYLMANDSDGVCSDGLVARWLTFEGGVNGVWIAQNPLAQPLLKFLGEDTVEIKHLAYHWMRDNVDPGQPTPNNRWNPPNWGTSDSYRHTFIQHQISTDWSLFGGLLRKLGHVANDGEITVGDAALAGLDPEVAWHDQQPSVNYLHAMHVSESRLAPEHIGLTDHDGAWSWLAAGITGSRRVTITLREATAHRIYERPLQGKGEMVFDMDTHSPWAETAWDATMPINERKFRDGTAPMARFAKNETRSLDAVLFDQVVADGEDRLDLFLSVREVDWSDFRNYLVFESPAEPSRLVAQGWVEADLTAPGLITFVSDDIEATLELQITQLDFNNPILSSVEARMDSDVVELWWDTDKTAQSSLRVERSDGTRWIVPSDEWTDRHTVIVEGLDRRFSHTITPRSEDRHGNLGKGRSVTLHGLR